jgi:hypothetical protein
VSVATTAIVALCAAVAILSIGYRAGRAHAAWRDYRSTRHDVPVKRRTVRDQSRGLFIGTLFLLGVLFAAGWNAGH